jgi:hypothetical protein
MNLEYLQLVGFLNKLSRTAINKGKIGIRKAKGNFTENSITNKIRKTSIKYEAKNYPKSFDSIN